MYCQWHLLRAQTHIPFFLLHHNNIYNINRYMHFAWSAFTFALVHPNEFICRCCNFGKSSVPIISFLFFFFLIQFSILVTQLATHLPYFGVFMFMLLCYRMLAVVPIRFSVCRARPSTTNNMAMIQMKYFLLIQYTHNHLIKKNRLGNFILFFFFLSKFDFESNWTQNFIHHTIFELNKWMECSFFSLFLVLIIQNVNWMWIEWRF